MTLEATAVDEAMILIQESMENIARASNMFSDMASSNANLQKAVDNLSEKVCQIEGYARSGDSTEDNKHKQPELYERVSTILNKIYSIYEL